MGPNPICDKACS